METKKAKAKVTSVIDRFDKDCRGILINGQRWMNIWRRRDRYGTRWESDRYSNEHPTVAAWLTDIRGQIEEGLI